jgi:hypothetical protein
VKTKTIRLLNPGKQFSIFKVTSEQRVKYGLKKEDHLNTHAKIKNNTLNILNIKLIQIML